MGGGVLGMQIQVKEMERPSCMNANCRGKQDAVVFRNLGCVTLTE